jgi:hypothetical protein
MNRLSARFGVFSVTCNFLDSFDVIYICLCYSFFDLHQHQRQQPTLEPLALLLYLLFLPRWKTTAAAVQPILANESRWESLEERTLLEAALMFKTPGSSTLTKDEFKQPYAWASESINGKPRLNRSTTQMTSKLNSKKEIYTAFTYVAHLTITGGLTNKVV